MKIYEIQISRFLKIYWNGATSICLHIVYGCFHSTVTELRIHDRHRVASKVSNMCYLDLYRKNFVSTDVMCTLLIHSRLIAHNQSRITFNSLGSCNQS